MLIALSEEKTLRPRRRGVSSVTFEEFSGGRSGYWPGADGELPRIGDCVCNIVPRGGTKSCRRRLRSPPVGRRPRRARKTRPGEKKTSVKRKPAAAAARKTPKPVKKQAARKPAARRPAAKRVAAEARQEGSPGGPAQGRSCTSAGGCRRQDRSNQGGGAEAAAGTGCPAPCPEWSRDPNEREEAHAAIGIQDRRAHRLSCPWRRPDRRHRDAGGRRHQARSVRHQLHQGQDDAAGADREGDRRRHAQARRQRRRSSGRSRPCAAAPASSAPCGAAAPRNTRPRSIPAT